MPAHRGLPIITRVALSALFALAAARPAAAQTSVCTVPTFSGDVVVFSTSGQWGCALNGGLIRLDNHASTTLSLVATSFGAAPASNPITHKGPAVDSQGHTLAGTFFALGDVSSASTSPFAINLTGRTDVQNGYLLFYAAYADLAVTNSGTFNTRGGGLALERGAFGQSLTFHSASGATFALLDDSGISDNAPAQPSLFINHQGASFLKAVSGGESVVSVAFNNDGLVSTEGNLRFSGGGTHTGGVFESKGAAGMITLTGEHDILGQVALRGGLTVLGQYGGPATRMFVASHAGLEVQSGMFVINAGGLQYDGEVRVATGAVLASGGDYFKGGTGSVLNVAGTFYNSTAWSDTGSSLTRVDGALQNVQGSAGQMTINGRLEHQGCLSNGVDSQFVLNGVAVSAAGSTLINEGNLWVNGQWQHDGTVVNRAGGVFNVGGNWNGKAAFINEGRLNVASGASAGVADFQQTQGMLVVDGTFGASNGVRIEGGVLMGNGTILGNLIVGGGMPATVAPGHSPGHLSVTGDLQFLAGGELDLEVQRRADGSLAWDMLTAGSMSFLDGSTLRVIVGAGVAGATPLTLSFLECGTGCSFGSGTQVLVEGVGGTSYSLDGTGGLMLNIPAQAVPEPPTWMLSLAGLAWAFLRRRQLDPLRRSVDA